MSSSDTDCCDEVGLGDKSVDVQSYDKYRGKMGVTDRIVILSKTLLRARVHYVQEKKKTLRCASTPDKTALCCEVLGEPDQRFGLVVFRYTTNEEGQLLTKDTLSGKVLLWVFSEKRYAELTAVHREFPLLNSSWEDPQIDLLVKCTEENYQKLSYIPCRDAFYKTKQTWYESLCKKLDKAVKRLPKTLGVVMSDDELREFLGVAPSKQSPALAEDEFSIDEIMD